IGRESAVGKRSPNAVALVKILLGLEDAFDGTPKQTPEGERQRQTRIVLAGLDGVDGLPGYLEPLGEIGLRPMTLSAEESESVLHSANRAEGVMFCQESLSVCQGQVTGYRFEVRAAKT